VNERDFADLAAGHALNALSDADERAYQEALARNPRWDSHVRDAAEAVAALSDIVEPVDPPASVRASLLARIADLPPQNDLPPQADAPLASDGDEEDFAAAGPAPVERDAAPSRTAGWGPRRWFTLAASIVAVLVLGFGAASFGQYLTRPASVVALEQIESAPDAQSASVTMPDGGSATAHWSASTGQSVLVTDGMPALSDDQTYELWFVRGETPIAAGIFETDAEGRATAILDGEFHSGDTIAVTVEPAGGSPDGTPSSAPVVAVATA
jgi:anti-sigma-K factor RskA